MEIKFFFKSAKKCFSNNPWYAIPRWFSDKKYEIKWAYQRVRYGYDDPWTWSLDHQLAETLPKVLRKMKKGLHGYPMECKDIKEWKAIIEKMAVGFESAQKLLNLDYMIKGKKDSYKENKIKRKKFEKQFDEGMNLFKKYFFNLWD